MWSVRRVSNRLYELRYENICSMQVKVDERKKYDTWTVVFTCTENNNICCTLSYTKRAMPRYDTMDVKFGTTVPTRKEEHWLMYQLLGTCADYAMRDTWYFFAKGRELRWNCC